MEGLIFGGAYLRRELLHFQIDWASLIVGSKFIVFALFYFVFEGNFPSTSSRGAYTWRRDLTEGFLRCCFGGAYIWRGLYTEGSIFGILRYFIITLTVLQVSADKLKIGSYNVRKWRVALMSWCNPELYCSKEIPTTFS